MPPNKYLFKKINHKIFLFSRFKLYFYPTSKKIHTIKDCK